MVHHFENFLGIEDSGVDEVLGSGGKELIEEPILYGFVSEKFVVVFAGIQFLEKVEDSNDIGNGFFFVMGAEHIDLILGGLPLVLRESVFERGRYCTFRGFLFRHWSLDLYILFASDYKTLFQKANRYTDLFYKIN